MDEKLHIALSELARKSASDTEKKFREIVGIILDANGLDGPDRETPFKIALELFQDVKRTRPTSSSDDHIEESNAVLQKSADLAIHSDWYATVLATWPAPIAHELAQLVRLMSQDTANVATADTALSQFRDCYEILIKFSAIALMQALASSEDEDQGWTKVGLYSRTSLGVWVGLLRKAIQHVEALPDIAAPVRRLADAARSNLMLGADRFSEIRNNLVGHGARALNPRETAELLGTCLKGGKLLSPGGREVEVPGLFQILEKMVNDLAFSDMALAVDVGERTISLDGVETIESWIKEAHGESHDFASEAHSVYLMLASGERLTLSPLVSARVCRLCGHRDIVIYDALQSASKGGVFDLMDYARGHKSRFRASEVEDIAAYFANIPKPDDIVLPEGKSRNDQRVIEALDSARVDRRYRSPTYLREAFSDFLQSRSKGVFWLQAPAHVGKTTFVQGVVSPLSVGEKTPILPRFADEKGGFVLGYYIRREIRVGLADFMNRLDDQLRRRFTSDANRESAPRYGVEWLEKAGSVEFVTWLGEWRDFAVKWGALVTDAPFILAIDGLDEAEDPEVAVLRKGSLIKLLPPEDLLPDGIYLLLTSRLPEGPDEVPSFLSKTIVPLYAART